MFDDVMYSAILDLYTNITYPIGGGTTLFDRNMFHFLSQDTYKVLQSQTNIPFFDVQNAFAQM